MAFTRITDLPSASAANDADILLMTQDDDDKQVTVEKIRTGLLRAANNLSDIPNAAAARANLGIEGENWEIVTGDTTITPGVSYIANDDSTPIVFTMPATVPEKSVMRFVGFGDAGWSIELGAGQTIYFGNVTTSSGGSFATTHGRDCITIICVEADDSFVGFGAQGNFNLF